MNALFSVRCSQLFSTSDSSHNKMMGQGTGLSRPLPPFPLCPLPFFFNSLLRGLDCTSISDYFLDTYLPITNFNLKVVQQVTGDLQVSPDPSPSHSAWISSNLHSCQSFSPHSSQAKTQSHLTVLRQL